MEGWIKLHRKVIDHWIFENPTYFRAWLIMLFTVNYESKKVLIHGMLFECKRGQSLLSLESWVDLFGVSKKKGAWTFQKVRTFFELLESDGMITKENLIKTTRLTICNYEVYQEQQQPNNNQITTKQQPNNNQITTTKESKESKERKEVFIEPTLSEVSEYCKERRNNVDPIAWINHYTAKGWFIGKNKMKDWKAAVRTWENNTSNGTPGYIPPHKKLIL
jgi:hypothetical protein